MLHKEPFPSSTLVRGESWKTAEETKPELILCHARDASRGCPKNNKNNHPFVAKSGNLGLIHNGRIFDEKYCELKAEHQTESDCDSEIILRMIEGYPDEQEKAIRLAWEALRGSHMAVAVAEISKEGLGLWLFRNEHRTLWMADARADLGQVFFFSTDEIWMEASDGLLSTDPKEIRPGVLHHLQIKCGFVYESAIPL